jgi:hypothetical protein
MASCLQSESYESADCSASFVWTPLMADFPQLVTERQQVVTFPFPAAASSPISSGREIYE